MKEDALLQLLDEINEFPSPTYEEWKQVAEQSLKGASFEKLLTKTYEGITLQPMYQKDVLDQISYIDSLPGVFPFHRGTKTVRSETTPWIVNQEVVYLHPKQANETIRHDLENGQTGIHLVLNDATKLGDFHQQSEKGMIIQNLEDLRILFDDVDLERFPIYVNAGALSLPFLAMFTAYLKERQMFLGNVKGCIGADPLGTLAMKGSLSYSLSSLYDAMAKTTEWAVDYLPQLSTILVQGQPYHNGGGSAVEELAFALATAVEYIDEMVNRGLSINDVASKITFSFSIGSNLFMEIAKFRAARLLWANVVKAFGGNSQAQKMYIHAETSKWNKTMYDPHVNILRGAIEAFTGAVAGVDSMHVTPFDECLKTIPSEFSRRIARNTQIILQEEAHLGKVNDPAGGSWYVEELTDEIAKKAWELFQQIEAGGGMLSALESGMVQNRIAEIVKKRDENIKRRKDVFVGTNKYANLNETILEEMQTPAVERVEQKTSNRAVQPLDTSEKELVDEAVKAAQTGALIFDLYDALPFEKKEIKVERIPQKRGAEPFEQLRLAMEKYRRKTGKREAVFLANIGPIAEYKPRADFVSGFFEAGGFEVLSNFGFETVEDAVHAANDSGASTIVIVAKDETYPQVIPAILESLAGQNKTIYVAGKIAEDEFEKYKQLGLEDMIHMQSNVYEVLAELQRKKGVLSDDEA